MKTRELVFAAIAAGLVSTAAAGTTDEDELLHELNKALPGTRISSIARTPLPGIYEVWMGSTVAFVSSGNVRYFIFGRLFDTQTMQDLTAPKLAKADPALTDRSGGEAEQVAVDRLPLADAIETVRGDGARRLYVFSDPACPYSRRLEPELAKLDNATIYTFIVPFQSRSLSLGIACAADRAKAWREFMLEGEVSSFGDSAGCAQVLDRNLALARQLHVGGTPTIVFDDGGRIAGYAVAEQIEARLATVPPASSQARASNEREEP